MTPATLVDARRALDGEAAPAALRWTDPDRQWRALVPALTAAMPELFALGDYAPEDRRGPVARFECIVDRSLPDAAAPEGAARRSIRASSRRAARSGARGSSSASSPTA